MLRRIVVGYDFSEAADDALAWVSDVARAASSHVAVVHVADLADTDPALSELRARLVEAVADLGVETSTHVVTGDAVADTLVRFADERDADAIVVAMTGGHPVRRWILGSVADAVLHRAHCPVIAYRGDDT